MGLPPIINSHPFVGNGHANCVRRDRFPQVRARAARGRSRMGGQSLVKIMSQPDLVRFGDAVRRRRKDLGYLSGPDSYSQEAFGDACGIDRSYTGVIERGEHNLALINIMKIIRTLKVQLSVFFSDMDERR